MAQALPKGIWSYSWVAKEGGVCVGDSALGTSLRAGDSQVEEHIGIMGEDHLDVAGMYQSFSCGTTVHCLPSHSSNSGSYGS